MNTIKKSTQKREREEEKDKTEIGEKNQVNGLNKTD